MKSYYITVWEQWEYGNKWGYLLSTNDIESTREQLKQKYERFTIQEKV